MSENYPNDIDPVLWAVACAQAMRDRTGFDKLFDLEFREWLEGWFEAVIERARES